MLKRLYDLEKPEEYRESNRYVYCQTVKYYSVFVILCPIDSIIIQEFTPTVYVFFSPGYPLRRPLSTGSRSLNMH